MNELDSGRSIDLIVDDCQSEIWPRRFANHAEGSAYLQSNEFLLAGSGWNVDLFKN